MDCHVFMSDVFVYISSPFSIKHSVLLALHDPLLWTTPTLHKLHHSIVHRLRVPPPKSLHDHCRCCVAVPGKAKSEAGEALLDIIIQLKAQTGKGASILGGEILRQ